MVSLIIRILVISVVDNICCQYLEPTPSKTDPSTQPIPLTKSTLDVAFPPFDLKCLDPYANNMLNYHIILDILPQIATFYFSGSLKSPVSLSGVQQSILLALGLQRKTLEDVEKELNVPTSQLLAMFVKIMQKMSSHFRSIVEGAVAEGMPKEAVPLRSLASGVNEDIRSGGDAVAAARDRSRPVEQNLDD